MKADLLYAELEAIAVARLLGVEPFLGPAATKATALKALESCTWVHFACHGKVDYENPMQGGLLLADGGTHHQ